MARMSAADVLLYENPYEIPNSYFPTGNPKRKHHRRRNPKSVTGELKSAFAGLDLLEMLGAVGGFAAAAMVPGYIIKTPTSGTLSIWQKLGKVGIGLGFAVVAKVAFTSAVRRPGIGSAALYGGVAGAGALALKEFTTIQPINRPLNSPRQLNPGTPPSAPNPPAMGRNTDQNFAPASVL